MKKHHNGFRWLAGIGIGLFGLTLWIGGTLGVQPVNAQAQPPALAQQDVARFRAVTTDLKFYSTDMNPIIYELYQGLVITIQDNVMQGSASAGTSYDFGGRAFSAQASIDLNGTYNPETGIMQGSCDQYFYLQYEPSEFSKDIGENLHYSGNFSTAPDGKFSPSDDTFHLNCMGTVTTLYLYPDRTANPSVYEAGFEIDFVRENEGDATEIPTDTSEETEIPEGTDPSCSPSVRGLSPSKPGDVISPGASYTGPDGQGVGIIQERWFLNGVNTTSIVWDGKQVQVELQYTCLDHVGYSRSYTIPAYQEIPDPSQPSGLPGTLGIPIGIGSIIAGVAGGIGVAGIAINQVIKGLPGKSPVQQPPKPIPPGEGTPPVQQPPAPAPPAEGAPPFEPPPAPTPPGEGSPPVQQPPSPTPPGEGAPPVEPPPAPAPPGEGAPPVEPPPAPAPPGEGTPPVEPPETPEPGEQPQPPKKEMTPEEKADLINRRSQMQEEVDNLRDKIKQTHGAVEKLTRLKKNNLIKFIFKKAIDLADWIMGSKVEVINKVTIDPTMKILIGEHDKSQDAEIIVNVHNRIQSLNAEIDDFRKQIKYLLDEINKTNQTLAGGGE